MNRFFPLRHACSLFSRPGISWKTPIFFVLLLSILHSARADEVAQHHFDPSDSLANESTPTESGPAPREELAGPFSLESRATSEDLTDQLEQMLLSDLPRIVTGAAFREQTLEEAPSGVLVITAEDIKLSGARTVGEALERHAGLRITGSDFVTLRGLGQANPVGGPVDASRVLLLIDGIRVNDAFADSFRVGLERGVTDILRIEVLKGPGSALYGTSAFAGIIQVVTAQGSDLEADSVKMRAGSGGRVAVEAREGNAGKALSHAVSLRLESAGAKSNRSGQFLELHSVAGWKGISWSGSYTLNTLSTEPTPADPALDEASAELAKATVEAANKAATTAAASAENNAAELQYSQQGLMAIQWERGLTKNIYAFTRISGQARSLVVDERDIDRDELEFGTEGRVRLRLNPALRFTSGVEGRHEGVDASDQNQQEVEVRRNVLGTYVQAEASPIQYTTFTAAFRFEQNDVWDQQHERWDSQTWDPRLGIVTQFPTGTVLKGFYGQASQAPSLSMLFIDSHVGETRVLANSQLQPERLTSLELEGQQNIGKALDLRLNLYHNRVEDLINPGPTAEESTIQFDNRYDARFLGAEMQIRWLLGRNFSTMGSIEWVEGKNLNDDRPLALMPTVKADLVMQGWVSTTTCIFGGISYLGERRGVPGEAIPEDVVLKPEVRVDARISTKVKNHWQLSLAVRNLFDRGAQDYANAELMDRPGAEAWVEVNFQPKARRGSREREASWEAP